jgi:DNA repair ATPase RecN
MYMWDNQVTALDNFLADTEVVSDAKFKEARKQLRDAKKRLTDAVVQFEAQASGEPAPEELKEDEQVLSYIEMAGDMVGLAREALNETVQDVKDLVKWEEPLAVINGYLADSEPYQELNKDLRRARSMVRVARKDLKNRIEDVFNQWRKSDMAGGRGDDEDEDEDK